MGDFQILCIKKVSVNNPHDRIVSIGGFNGKRRWSLTQQDAVHSIENLGNRFWVGESGNCAQVVVAMHQGHKYIKTENEEGHPSNLLSLPECPAP